jgi:mRNA-degrading endonuclease YafQ of YafQ-DinJ toxin-antitoxin module
MAEACRAGGLKRFLEWFTVEAARQVYILAGTRHFGGRHHIEPDWLLLYKLDGKDLILAGTSTHADLFR